MCRLELICTTHTMECKENQGYMDQSVYQFEIILQNHLPMIMIEASSLLIGTTIALMSKPLDCPPNPLSGLGSLRYMVLTVTCVKNRINVISCCYSLSNSYCFYLFSVTSDSRKRKIQLL